MAANKGQGGSFAVLLPHSELIPSNAKTADYEARIKKYAADMIQQLGGQTCWIVDLPTWRLDIERGKPIHAIMA